MAELFQASHQWMSRPADERYTSLIDMRNHFQGVRDNSRAVIVPSNRLEVRPDDKDPKALAVYGPNGHGYNPTHWAFGQLAQLGESPAGYLRTLPAALAADCINYGLKFKRDIEDVGVLLQRGETPTLTAATGPRYGRIWNVDVIAALVKRFGDGINGDFRVPGEWGKKVDVTKANTTLYASDRDFFVFLADEVNRIEMPNRRGGQTGQLARGFFIWNSEVGSRTLGIATFLFDYVCGNRIVWGAEAVNEVRIRHSASAPERWIEEVLPAIETYSRSSLTGITKALEVSRETRLGDKLDDFLANRFGKRNAEKVKLAHLADEGRPMETMWDVITGATAWARDFGNQDERIEVERTAGKILDLVAKDTGDGIRYEFQNSIRA